MCVLFDAIRFAGYKSFPSDKNVDIPRLGYINLFIGKNNCGKSSVLDVIGSICQPDYRSQLDQKPETTLTGYRIRKEEIEKLNRRYSISGYYRMLTHVDELLWKRLTTYGTYNGGSAFNEKYESEDNEGIQEPYARWDDIWLGNAPNNGYYAKISAERNIEPEYAIEKLQLFADGRGATNIIRSIINNKNYDEQLVEVTLLEALNQIMGQDAQFNALCR